MRTATTISGIVHALCCCGACSLFAAKPLTVAAGDRPCAGEHLHLPEFHANDPGQQSLAQGRRRTLVEKGRRRRNPVGIATGEGVERRGQGRREPPARAGSENRSEQAGTKPADPVPIVRSPNALAEGAGEEARP